MFVRWRGSRIHLQASSGQGGGTVHPGMRRSPMGVPNQEVEVREGRLLLRRIRRQLRKENAFVHLLRVVTSISNESTTMDEALQTTLDAVCGLTGWPVGHALLRIDEKDELASTGLWHLDGPERFEPFRKISEALTFGG